MLKPAFFGVIQSSWDKYRQWQQDSGQTIWYKIYNSFLNLILSLAAVLPLLSVICRTVPFSYEVNDDAAIVQILDGSYTGTPDGHSIFVRYPLSWLIKTLYAVNPAIRLAGELRHDVNWYVAVIVTLEVFALAAVLFRILHYFTYNRILLCILFDIGFVMLWLPCFSNLTFSTAAAFMGCMGMLFFGFCRREEAWRPWNLLILGILLVSAWSLRRQCFLMVLPFLCLEFVFKYHIHFFRSVKPWFAVTFLVVVIGASSMWNHHMYGSREWQDYLQYNQDRAYLQDYAGFPQYEGNEAFYQAAGISENGRDAMAKYTYCLVDGFSTDWVEQTWRYVKAQEKEEPFARRMQNAVPKAGRYLLKAESAEERLKEVPVYLFSLLFPLAVLTAAYLLVKEMLISVLPAIKKKVRIKKQEKKTLSDAVPENVEEIRSSSDDAVHRICLPDNLKGAVHYIWTLLSIILMGIVLWLEWIYLAMNGRFPQRVEETIRLLTLCVGVLAVSRLLSFWRRNRLTHIPVIVQIVVLALFVQSGFLTAQIEKVQGQQEYHLRYASEKSQILDYCGGHPESWFVLDTRSFTKTSRPSDDLHQNNWIMSGSWTAYSPLYTEKLAGMGTGSLGSEFLLRENVFLITKGKKNVSALLGLPEDREAEAVVADELMTDSNNFYVVYKITGIRPVEEEKTAGR